LDLKKLEEQRTALKKQIPTLQNQLADIKRQIDMSQGALLYVEHWLKEAEKPAEKPSLEKDKKAPVKGKKN